MSISTAFKPSPGNNQVLTSGAASQNASLLKNSQSVRISNSDGTNPVHVRISKSGGDATTGDSVILPGETVIFGKGVDEINLDYIQSGGAAIFHVQCGEGKA